MIGEAWNMGELPRDARLVTVAEIGAARTVSSRPIGFRFKGGRLQYACQWTEGARGGIQWVDVPSVPADAPDTE